MRKRISSCARIMPKTTKAARGSTKRSASQPASQQPATKTPRRVSALDICMMFGDDEKKHNVAALAETCLNQIVFPDGEFTFECYVPPRRVFEGARRLERRTEKTDGIIVVRQLSSAEDGVEG